MTSDPDSSDRLKKELLAEAKEDLEAWGKRRFWIVLAVFALVGAIGVQAIVQVALKSDIEKMRDDNQKVSDPNMGQLAATVRGLRAAGRQTD